MWTIHAMLAEAREQDLRREIRDRRWVMLDALRSRRRERRRDRAGRHRRTG
jgi:hypothetical protein